MPKPGTLTLTCVWPGCPNLYTESWTVGSQSAAMYSARQKGWQVTNKGWYCPEHSGVEPHNRPSHQGGFPR